MQMPIDGATAAEYAITDPSQNGFFSVAITLNGCDAMSECVLLLIESVEEVEDNWSAGIFPNPAATDLNIWSSKPIVISVYNSLGALVLSERINSLNHFLDVSTLPEGMYQVLMQNGDSLRSSELLIKR